MTAEVYLTGPPWRVQQSVDLMPAFDESSRILTQKSGGMSRPHSWQVELPDPQALGPSWWYSHTSPNLQPWTACDDHSDILIGRPLFSHELSVQRTGEAWGITGGQAFPVHSSRLSKFQQPWGLFLTFLSRLVWLHHCSHHRRLM